jgi:hypothetical protein
MGKQNELLRIGKTLTCAGFSLADSTALNGKISDSAFPIMTDVHAKLST